MVAVGLEQILLKIDRERRVLRTREVIDRNAAARLNVLDTYTPVLTAAQSIIAQFGAAPQRTPHPRRGKIDPQSTIGLTVAVLRDGPLHLNEIVGRIAAQHGRAVKATTISPRLARLARAGKVFQRVGPSTYALREPEAIDMT